MEKTKKLDILLSVKTSSQRNLMSSSQKKQFFTQIKKDATYYLLSVSNAIENKNYQSAKMHLVYICDSLSLIQNPDNEVSYLLEVCYMHLAKIHEFQIKKNEKRIQKEIQIDKQGPPVLLFRYDKFKGQFQIQNSDQKSNQPQSVKFYMSKINSILFNFQNSESQNSLLEMLKIYGHSFLIVLVLTLVLILILWSGFNQKIFGQKQQFGNYTLFIAIGVFFVIPLVAIYKKQPLQKNTQFFKQKLGEQINKINEECQRKKKGIKFEMPEGIEINVIINRQQISSLNEQ